MWRETARKRGRLHPLASGGDEAAGSMVASEREGRFATFAWLAHILFIGKQSVHEHIDLASSERLIDHFRRPINILTLDGGGIRGRCLLTMVEELEETLGAPISHYFDLIGGTSM